MVKVDADLLEFRPPAVTWLASQQDVDQPWRFTTVQDPQEQKTYNANLGMYDGLQDVRGYDSIIPKQYADYMGQLQTQGDLLYNRIGPIYTPNYPALDDPLFDLLGVRYVVSTGALPNEGYRLVYDNEVKIYENEDVLPRALFVPAGVQAGENVWDTIRSQDIRQVVVLDTNETLPAFAASRLGRDFRVTTVFDEASDCNSLPGIEVVGQADVVLVSVRRRVLPPPQLK